MRLWSVVLLAILLGVALGPVRAQSADFRQELGRLEQFRRAVEVDADSLQYSADQRRVVAQGHVRLIFEDRALTADEVSVNLDDEVAIATGHVVLMDGESRLEGDRIEYNYRSNLGTVTNGQGFLPPSLSFSGREIRREAEREFAIEDARVTNCRACEPPPQTPDWEMRARRLRIFQDEFLVSRDSSIWIKGLPALYLPVATLPIGPRRTGFLIPRFGYGNRDGFSSRTPFFWAISRSQDVTITPIYRTNRGFEFDGEYRYLLDNNSRGSLFARYVHDNLTLDKTDSAEVRWRHEQFLAPTWTFKADVDYLSEQSLLRQFVDTPVAERTQAASRSSIFLDQMTDRYMFLGLLELTQDLAETQESRATRLPDVRFQWLPAPLFHTPLLFEGETSAAYLGRSGANDAGRFDIRPVLHLPAPLSPWVSTATSVAVRETAYTEAEQSGRNARFIPDVTEQVGSRLARRYDNPGFGLLRLTHVIEPSLTYLYVPWQDQQSLPQFDRVDFISPQNRVVYRVTNHWLGRRQEGEVVRSREVASLELAQSVNLDPRTREYSDVYLQTLTPERVDQAVTDVRALGNGFSRVRERRLSDLAIQGSVSPWPTVALRGGTALDLASPKSDAFNTGVSVALPRRIFLDLGHTWVRDGATSGLVGKAGIALLPTLRLDLLTRVDPRVGSLREQGVALIYNTCCWDLTVRFTHRDSGPGLTVENDVKVTVNIRTGRPAPPAASVPWYLGGWLGEESVVLPEPTDSAAP